MPKFQMIYKAGKLSFLLVCLFLCTACEGRSKTVFIAGTEPVVEKSEETEEITHIEENTPEHGLVNINTAEKEELMTLPGIGEVRAIAIMEHRKQNGEFEKIEDIMNVKGIKTGIFNKISSLICVK